MQAGLDGGYIPRSSELSWLQCDKSNRVICPRLLRFEINLPSMASLVVLYVVRLLFRAEGPVDVAGGWIRHCEGIRVPLKSIFEHPAQENKIGGNRMLWAPPPDYDDDEELFSQPVDE